MAGNPFFSGRIPQELHERIQEHCAETGETKTQILINALAAYLNHPVKENPSSSGIFQQEFAALQEQVATLEKSILAGYQNVIEADNRKIDEELNRQWNEFNLFQAQFKTEVWLQLKKEFAIWNESLQKAVTKLTDRLEAVEDSLEVVLSESPGNSPTGEKDGRSPSPRLQEEPSGNGEANSSIPYLEPNTEESAFCEAPGLEDVPGNSPFLNAANLARRLGISKSVISRRKCESTFEEWSKGKDPAGVGWRFPGKGQRFYPVDHKTNELSN